MSGAVPTLPNTPSWHAAQLKEAQEQLYLYLYRVLKKPVQRYVYLTDEQRHNLLSSNIQNSVPYAL
jgi:hypothetical protein